MTKVNEHVQGLEQSYRERVALSKEQAADLFAQISLQFEEEDSDTPEVPLADQLFNEAMSAKQAEEERLKKLNQIDSAQVEI